METLIAVIIALIFVAFFTWKVTKRSNSGPQAPRPENPKDDSGKNR